MAILISDRINFKSKTVTRNKGHYIIIKISIHQEDIMIIYAPNNRAPKNTKQILTALKGETECSIIVVGEVQYSWASSSPVLACNRYSKSVYRMNEWSIWYVILLWIIVMEGGDQCGKIIITIKITRFTNIEMKIELGKMIVVNCRTIKISIGVLCVRSLHV